jgi:hypothetical protein
VYDAIYTEQSGKPAVLLAAMDFGTDAQSAASSRGMPGLRIIPEGVTPECTVQAKIDAGIDAAMGEIISALIRPLTEEEKAPRPKEAEKLARIVFKGDLKEVNRFFYKRGWTDGFPIIPPTEEEVSEMLTGTDLPADQVVGKIIPRLGKATVEKIAINAVMAGALPTYMPLLITAVEILEVPEARFGTWEVSTGSWIPFWIINGPIRHALHINSGQGALSPGDIANAAIGRAMSLIIKNIGGARKGIEDMGIFGSSGKYTMVLAENEEASPWEPLHMQQGFKKEDNTITASFPNQVYTASPFGSDSKGILNSITAVARGNLTILMQPQYAQSLAEEGWTKKEIAAFVAEYSRMQAYKTSGYYIPWSPNRIRPPFNPEDSVRTIPSPNSIRTVVAGGSGGLMIDLISGGSGWTTKKVTLPANWDKLVAKYKDVVPNYVRY